MLSVAKKKLRVYEFGNNVNLDKMPLQNLVHLASVLLTGLLAGLFYGYDCSVIKGLSNVDDQSYLSAFQQINKAIQNPYFFISFIGTIIVLPGSAWLYFKTGMTNSFYYTLAAAIIYFGGVIVITAAANIPLNNALDRFNISNGTAEDLQNMRNKFESAWNKWHHIRTYASILTFLLAILALAEKP